MVRRCCGLCCCWLLLGAPDRQCACRMSRIVVRPCALVVYSVPHLSIISERTGRLRRGRAIALDTRRVGDDGRLVARRGRRERETEARQEVECGPGNQSERPRWFRLGSCGFRMHIRPGTSKQRREGIAPAERRGVALREKNAGEVDFRRCCPSSRSHCCACDGELARPAADEPGSGGRLRSATSIKKSEKIVQPRDQPPIWSRTPDRPWAWLRASAQGRTSTPPPRLQWFQSLRWRHPRELAARGGCSKSPRVGRAATETRSPTDGGSTALDSFEHGGESRR